MSNISIEQQVKLVFSTFEELEKTSKVNKKLELLNKIKDLYVFKKIVYIVYSTEIKTYISYKRLITFPCGTKQIASFEDFMELVGRLSKRDIVGNKAEEEIKKFLLSCDKFHCKWYKRILSKDLRINVGYSLIEKLYNKQEKIVERFNSPMMAFNIRKLKDPIEFLKNKKWIYEEKIDGLRCLTIIDKGTFVCYSRNGKRLYGAEKYISKGLNDKSLNELSGYVIDGEFYSKNWSQTMTSIFDQNVEIESFLKDVTYNVFDIIPINKYESGKYEVTLSNRKKVLEKIFKSKLLTHPFRFVPYYILKNPEDIKLIYSLADKFINKGFEGIILKRLDSFYVCKRSYDWIKVKDIKTIDVLCIGIEKSYKRPGEISALIFRYKGHQCKVGAGLTDYYRKYFYDHPDSVVGKIIEIQYQEESKDGCLRFPVFIRVRLDKEIPDA